MKRFFLLITTLFGLIMSVYAKTITFDFVKDTYGLTRQTAANSPYITDGTAICNEGILINLWKASGNGFRLWSDGLRVYTGEVSFDFYGPDIKEVRIYSTPSFYEFDSFINHWNEAVPFWCNFKVSSRTLISKIEVETGDASIKEGTSFTYTYGGETLKYRIEDESSKTVEIIGGPKKPSGNRVPRTLLIPSEVEYDNSVYRVGAIRSLAGCEMEAIELPGTIEKIKPGAFMDCTKLKAIVIPNTVTSVGSEAFANCTSLEFLQLSEGLDKIESKSFNNCINLKDIKIPDHVTSVGSKAFANCTSLEFLQLSVGLDKIESNSFSNCKNLKDIIIPNTVSYIGSEAFSDCAAVKEFIIPPSVKEVGTDAFIRCTGLTKAAYPSTIQNPFPFIYAIGYNPKEAIIDNGIIYENGGKSIVFVSNDVLNLIIPDAVTDIKNRALSNCHLTSLTIGADLRNIGYHETAIDVTKVIWQCNTPPSGYTYVYGKINFVPNINYKFNNQIVYPLLSSLFEVDGIIYVPVNPAQRICDIIDCSYSEDFTVCTLNPEVTYKGICMTISKINDYAFYRQSSLKSLNINYSGELPKYAFYQCANLEGANIPSSITNIGEFAFYGCAALKEITLNNAGYIGKNAFQNCALDQAATLVISETVTDIQKEAFRGSTQLRTISLKNSGCVGMSAFMDCSNITDMEIDNKGNLGESAFQNSAQNKPAKLTLGPNVTEIGKKTFYECHAIETLIANNKGDIGQESFSGCSNLREITLNNHGSIGASAFKNSANRYPCTLRIEETISMIEDNAFQGCSTIKSLFLRNHGNIGTHVFFGCSSIEELNLENTGSIGSYCFSDCTAAKSLSIASSVTSIGNYAFSGCSSISDVTIEAMDDLSDNRFQQGSSESFISSIILGSNGSNPLFNDCPLDEVYIGRKLNYATSAREGYSPFYRNTSLRSVKITDAETQIYDYEFYGCSNLQEVSIGDGVKAFGKYSFSGCSKLEAFEFGRSVATIGEEAFSDCTAMTELISHNPVPPVCGNEALDDIIKWNCILHVPNNSMEAYSQAPQWQNFFFINSDIESEKFIGYDGLYYRVTDMENYLCEVVDPEIVPENQKTQLHSNAEVNDMTNVVIPETILYNGVYYSVKGIGENAFKIYETLERITLPATIEYIGNGAFLNNADLMEMTIGATNPPEVFDNTFNEKAYAEVKLNVPSESLSLYQNSAVWNQFYSLITGIDSIHSDGVEELFRWNLQGMPVDQSYKGVVIINYSDGSTKKMIIK